MNLSSIGGLTGFNRNVEWIGVLNCLRHCSFDVYIAASKMGFEVRRVFCYYFIAPLARILVLRVNYNLKKEYLYSDWMSFCFLVQNPVRIKA